MNQQGPLGRTPLYFALAHCSYELTELLLQGGHNGASTQVRDEWGMTPLHVICKMDCPNQTRLVKLILDYIKSSSENKTPDAIDYSLNTYFAQVKEQKTLFFTPDKVKSEQKVKPKTTAKRPWRGTSFLKLEKNDLEAESPLELIADEKPSSSNMAKLEGACSQNRRSLKLTYEALMGSDTS